MSRIRAAICDDEANTRAYPASLIRVQFHFPEQGAYDAFDVGIILQNLLQNAVEA